MKKFLAVILILAAVIFAAIEIFLPRIVADILKEQVVKATHAQEVQFQLKSSPNAKIILGQIDSIYGTASSGQIGDVDFQALTADVKNINVDVKELLFPTPNINDKQRTEKILKSIGKAELTGIITEDGLKNFMQRKVEHGENMDVKITPNEVTATGHIKLLGRDADVDVSGTFIMIDDDIYFHATNLDIRNTLVRNVQIDRFLGDVKILESANLPAGLKFTSVKMREGDVLITAAR